MSYTTDLTTVKTTINTDWTTQTAPSSISPADGGGNVEALIDTILTGGLPQILSLGNVANDSVTGEVATMTLIDAANAYQVGLGAGDVMIKAVGGTIPLVQLSHSAGVGFVDIKDGASANTSRIQSGSLTADRTYTTPNRSGTLQLSGNGVNPTAVAGAAAGTGAVINISSISDDRKGTIEIVTGTGCSAGTLCTVTFSQAYPIAVIVFMQGRGTPAVQENTNVWASGSSPFFLVICETALADSTNYLFQYIVQN